MLHAPLLRVALPLAVAVLSVSCAAKQRIAIECLPETGAVFVDGERLEELPSELVLRSDRPHTVFYKDADAVPELVVLKSEEVEGRAVLSPSTVCIRPRTVSAGRELRVEIDPSVSAEPPRDEELPTSTIDVEPRPDFTP